MSFETTTVKIVHVLFFLCAKSMNGYPLIFIAFSEVLFLPSELPVNLNFLSVGMLVRTYGDLGQDAFEPGKKQTILKWLEIRKTENKWPSSTKKWQKADFLWRAFVFVFVLFCIFQLMRKRPESSFVTQRQFWTQICLRENTGAYSFESRLPSATSFGIGWSIQLHCAHCGAECMSCVLSGSAPSIKQGWRQNLKFF